MSQTAYIKDLDLSYIAVRLVEREKWAIQDAQEAIRRYKNFLILLCKYPTHLLAPAPDMDEVWHTHLLFTKEYMHDCHQIFGEYLHHSPFQNSSTEEADQMQEAQSLTAELYSKEFHESYFLELAIASFWPSP